MIVRLAGTLTEVFEDSIVLERDGVSREVLVPRFSIAELASYRGRQVTLNTTEFFEGSHTSGHLVPRMLGFLHEEDRLFFSRFVAVKGIGPRKALKALAEPVRRIASWIEAEDSKALTRLPGIGKRVADLIIASLKGKMKDLALPGETELEGTVELTQAQCDAREILVAWGDPRGDADRWLQRSAQLYPETQSADEWVRLAYRVKSGVER